MGTAVITGFGHGLGEGFGIVAFFQSCRVPGRGRSHGKLGADGVAGQISLADAVAVNSQGNRPAQFGVGKGTAAAVEAKVLQRGGLCVSYG